MTEATDAISLRQLRTQSGLSQSEMARRMGTVQSRVSNLEHLDIGQVTLGALHRYVRALGGELRIYADFGDSQVLVGPFRPSVSPRLTPEARARLHWVTIIEGGDQYQQVCHCTIAVDHAASLSPR